MKIDLNCDLGEDMGNDAQLMPFLGSCNIACGGHFGDTQTMTAAVKLAKKHNVNAGAHPSFPDKENFGRKVMAISRDGLQQSLTQQISDFQQVCSACDIPMHHIKLHGALYNLAVNDAEIAAVVLNAFASVQADIKIYVPFNSAISILADDYFPIVYEAFADRAYNADLSLVSRDKPNAVITDKQQAWQQVKSIIQTGKVPTINGQMVTIKADTFCVHGDNKNAFEILQYIHQCL
ncbi:MAG: 5-oxoprolinase subunit PxpA [Proteobacteria bacterium]|nr:5-oxoprolinase subunit PxpA [Pseudomonadota bacterium]